MATSRKKPARTAKANPVEPNPWSGWLRDGAGWMALVLSALFFLALLGNHTAATNQHWMGPYLGDALGVLLRRATGNMASLLWVPLFALGGLWLLTGNFSRWGRRCLGTLFTLLFLSILLNLRVADLPVLTEVHLEENGGLLGHRLHLHIVRPIFGAARLGPLLLLIPLAVLSVLFALGLPISIWRTMGPRLMGLGSALRSLLARLRPSRFRRPEQNHDAWREPETSDYPLVRTHQVRPVEGRALGKSASNRKSTSLDKTSADPTFAATPDATVLATQALPDGGAIATLEALLENAPSMDPRMVRKLRDELAELRRTKEINEWEDRKAGKLVIEGLVQKGGPILETPKPIAPPASPDKTQVTPSAKKLRVESPDASEHSEEPSDEPRVERKSAPEPTAVPFVPYRIPAPSEILAVSPVQEVDFTAEELENISAALELQLENFRVKGKVVGIATGPVITRFELEPGPGVKVARFAGLADDLALSLKANSIRVLAPIPGKSAVGIEIPNRRAHLVYCRDIFESSRFAPKSDNIQIALGKDITGNAFVMDLGRAPHLLIAGQTGSGKSVCINTIMASILFSKSPDDLRMILVDPKVVELKPYEKIPHLLHPVVTDPDTAVQALKWACWEMDRRYEVLAKAKVRNLAGFNAKHAKGELDELVDPADAQHMPFIVIIIDELADLMMVAGKEVEVSIARLAQKARAVGVHLILATQRPSVNVITGTIKANLPTRISFKVASHIDARTVMDRAGAEKLLGRGDMLFRSIDDPEPCRVHGGFLSDDEAEQVAKACSNQHVDYPQLSSFQFEDEVGEEGGADLGPRDDLFWDAAELAVHTGGLSTSSVQRRMQVGYARAGRIVDQLEKAGIVGKERGSKPRDVLIDEEGLMNLQRTQR